MQRFSRLFWFTAIAGTISSAFFTCALLWYFTTVNDSELTALCVQGKVSCSDAIHRVFQVFCITEAAGTILLFWFAHRIGRGFIKPAPQAVTDAGQ